MAPAKLAMSMTATTRSTAQLQKRNMLSSHRGGPLSVCQSSKYFQDLVVLLLLYVHAAVRFRQQLFSVYSVFRIDSAPDAQREPFHAADLTACIAREFAQADTSCFRSRRAQPGSYNHKLVSAHSRHVVIFTAGALQSVREVPQNPVAFKMTKQIVDFLKAIQVTNHHGQRSV